MNLRNELSSSEQVAALRLLDGGGTGGPTQGDRGLPTIISNDRYLPEVSEDILNAIIQQNDPPVVFRRGTDLVRITFAEDKEQGNTVRRPVVDIAGENYVRGLAGRSANFVRVKATRKGEIIETPTDPPLNAVKDILAMRDWGEFPLLSGITEAPILHDDGFIHTEPGYDPVSGLYFAGGINMPDIPERPTQTEIAQAVELLKEPFLDFPFADDRASLANSLGAVLAVTLRPVIYGPVPAVLINKHQQGAGATLLSNVLSLIGTGLPAYAEAMPGGRGADEELRKLITAILIAGRPLVCFDNVDGYLNSSVLGALLTTQLWQDRRLGSNELASVPQRTVWVINGNNVQLQGDLPRRCFEIMIDPKMPRPWLREPGTFRHPNLLEWVAEHRGHLLAAVFTLARAWVQAGRPLPNDLPVLGGFEEFVEVVGGILAFAGIGGFLENLSDMYERSEEDDGWAGFLSAWYEVFGEEGATVSQIVDELLDSSHFADTLPPELDITDKQLTRKLGRRLAKREGFRHVNGLFIERGGTYRRAIQWRCLLTEGYTFETINKGEDDIDGFTFVRNSPWDTEKQECSSEN